MSGQQPQKNQAQNQAKDQQLPVPSPAKRASILTVVGCSGVALAYYSGWIGVLVASFGAIPVAVCVGGVVVCAGGGYYLGIL
jgi:hypothetical protein